MARSSRSARDSPQSTPETTPRTRYINVSMCVVFVVLFNWVVVAFLFHENLIQWKPIPPKTTIRISGPSGALKEWKPISPKTTIRISDPSGALKEAKRASFTDVATLLQRFLPEKKQTNITLPVTSALMSTYKLVDQRPRVGDTAHFVIQAKDSDGRNKTTGGDFWFTVLTSVAGDHPTAGGRTAGSVVDHNNGTYSVFFYAGWPGIAYVHVTLAAPSETTKWLREKFWPVERKVFWRGTFMNNTNPKRKPLTKATLCYLMRNVTSSKDCLIDHNPTATGLTALHCERPTEPLTCDDIRWLTIDAQATDRRAREIVGKDLKLFQGVNFMQRLVHGPQSINIAVSPNRTESAAPACKPNSRHLMNDGFWLDGTWHHLQCQVLKWDDAKAVGECLRHKHVYILADSTVRSWYHEITRKLGFPWKILGGKMSKNNYYAGLDLNMTFRFHPRVVTYTQTTLEMTPYEVDTLDSLPTKDCGRYIFVFSPWAHFTQWTRDSYVERALLLRDAVLRLRERCPDVPIVLKGAHPREHPSSLMHVMRSDYTHWALGRTLRIIFHGTGVYYFDMWQMNLAYGPSNIHMPAEVISEEVNWFLTYVCGSKNSTS